MSNTSGDEILKWYLVEKYHPDRPIGAAIVSFQRIDRVDEALRLSLDYTHLPSAIKLIKKYPDEALKYFQKIFDDDPNHPNAAYALGVALFHLAKLEEAKLYLEKALKLATASARKSTIEELLRKIQYKTSDK